MSKLMKENIEGQEGYLLRCGCYSEFISICIFDEDITDPSGGLVYLDLYKNYHSCMRNSWWSRVKAAVRIFWDGSVCGYDFVMAGDEAIELGEKIIELGKKVQKK